MPKHLGLAALGAVLVAALSLVGGTATADPPPSSVIVGHAYVNDNAAGSNTVAAFDRHADGSLTPIPGSHVIGGRFYGHLLDALAGQVVAEFDDRLRPGRYLTGVG